MDNFTAIGIIENFTEPECSEERALEAWQHIINSGLVWSLQGWYGRSAMRLIERGLCTAPNRA